MKKTYIHWLLLVIATIINQHASAYTKEYFPKDSTHIKSSNTSNTLTSTKKYCKPIVTAKGSIKYRTVKLGNTTHALQFPFGYMNRTNKKFTITRGKEEVITLISTINLEFNQHWSVWIDYNHDGKFSSDEKVMSEKAQVRIYRENRKILIRFKNSEYFTVPNTAKLGETRIRVASTAEKKPIACASNLNGLIRDYTVNIQDNNSKINNSINNLNISTYPNPTDSFIKVSSNQPLPNDIQCTILNYSGTILKTVPLENNSIDVQNLKKGVYFLKINNNSINITKRFIKQ